MSTLSKIVSFLAVPILLVACGSKNSDDLTFARTTFESLARGDTAVRDRIDWATLNSLGVNAGAQYVNIASDTEREEFKTAFITQFAASFRDSGGKVESFTNWRVTGHSEDRTEVSADSPNGVLRVTVTERDNQDRVSRLEMVVP